MSLKSDHHNIAIVGVNQETAALFPTLLDTPGVSILRILNPELEDLALLRDYPQLDVVIDTTDDADVGTGLRALNLENIDILSALSARIFFLTGRREVVKGGTPSERENILSSLHDIRQAVLLSRNKEELLKLILNVAIRSVAADTGSIMLLDTEKRYLTIDMADGIPPEIVTSTEQKVGKGIAGKVVRTGEAVLLRGPLQREDDGGDAREGLVSSICCPLVIGSDPVGALSVNSTSPGKEFTDSDLDYVKQLAEFTADIIRTSTQFQRSAESAFALSVVDRARSILDLDYPFDERLNLLLLRVVNSLSGEICNYYSYSREDQSFLLRASSSFKFDLLRGKRLKFNAQLSRKVLASQETVSLDMVDKVTHKRKWYIAHPIRVDREIAGLLFLHLIADRADVRVETETVGKIGDMLAGALANNLQIVASRVKSEQLSAISEASYDLAGARNLTELGQAVVSVACLVLEAQSCVFRLKRGESDELDVLDSFSLGSLQQYRQIEELDARVAGETFETGKVVALSGVKNISKYGAEELCKSALSMCLKSGDRRVGTLSIYDKAAVDMFGSSAFSESDKDVFLNICLQTSKALERFISMPSGDAGYGAGAPATA